MNSDTGGPVDSRNYKYDRNYEFSEVPEEKKMNRDSADRCLYFLASSAEPHAAWAARRKFLDKYAGIVLAMEEDKAGPGEAQEKNRKAKKSIPYMRVLRDLEEAVYHEMLLAGLRHSADKKFSGWQTLNANLRTGVNL